MRTLNIKVEDTLRQTEPVCAPYKDNLDNVVDNNIDDTVTSTTDTNFYPLKQTTSDTQLGAPFDIPLPSGALVR